MYRPQSHSLRKLSELIRTDELKMNKRTLEGKRNFYFSSRRIGLNTILYLDSAEVRMLSVIRMGQGKMSVAT